MGRPKALLPWRGRTLLAHQIRSLTEAGVAEVVVVLGHQADAITPYAGSPKARVIVNPDYRLGRTTSIKAGIRATDPDAEAILLLAVDQPRTAEIVSAVVRAHRQQGALITSPRFQGHGGHPVMFAAALKGELERISEDRQGIREVFESHRREVVEVHLDEPMVRLDLNTPEEYEEATRRYGA